MKQQRKSEPQTKKCELIGRPRSTQLQKESPSLREISWERPFGKHSGPPVRKKISSPWKSHTEQTRSTGFCVRQPAKSKWSCQSTLRTLWIRALPASCSSNSKTRCEGSRTRSLWVSRTRNRQKNSKLPSPTLTKQNTQTDSSSWNLQLLTTSKKVNLISLWLWRLACVNSCNTTCTRWKLNCTLKCANESKLLREWSSLREGTPKEPKLGKNSILGWGRTSVNSKKKRKLMRFSFTPSETRHMRDSKKVC